MSELALKALKDRRKELLRKGRGQRKWKEIALRTMDTLEETLEELIACKNALWLKGEAIIKKK